MVLMDLGHANDTRICQRHRGVAIFSHQPVQHADMLLQPKRHCERAILEPANMAGFCALGKRASR